MMSIHHLLLAGLSTLLPLTVLYFPVVSDPVAKGRPFVIYWNAPTRHCLDIHGVRMDLDSFDIIMNTNHSFLGPEVVIFYNTQLGLYPFYNQDNKPVNGGLPQNTSLENHLSKVHEDLRNVSVDNDFKGVVVVDWEHWRPLWNRNWKQMALYQQRSLELISQRHPSWHYRRVRRLAKRHFEIAAQNLMESTLLLGRKLSPNGFWGFYGFPECYNFEYKNSSQNYTGKCPEDEVQRNDAIGWLWRISRALYPHIYLDQSLRDSVNVKPFVQHRLEEAIRVSKLSPAVDLPVLPYARIVYTYTMDFLTQDDLVQTIGLSAALGAAGVVLWGNADYSSSKESCLAVKSYTEETLGRYLKNVTTGALLCSISQCSGHGRCVRKHPDTEAHLHLDPSMFIIRKHPQEKGFVVSEKTSSKKKPSCLWSQFRCHCYRGWRGSNCKEKMQP